jgi:hypothetical protein
MPYEAEIRQLAAGAVARHGSLQEVLFLESNKDSLLVFEDGTVIPILHREYKYDLRHEPYAVQLAIEHSGTDYFSMLAFGYSGTGPACYAEFLLAAGFQAADVEHLKAPLKLKKDGAVVHGSRANGLIAWEDGSPTPEFTEAGMGRLGTPSGPVHKAAESNPITIEVCGITVEEARDELKRRLGPGQVVTAEKVKCDGREVWIERSADNIELAYAKAEAEIPRDARIALRREIGTGGSKQVTVFAAREEDVEGKVREHFPATAVVRGVRLINAGRKGFLGIGARLAKFEADITDQAGVEIRYRQSARIEAQIAYKNRGTLQDTLSHASTYWMSRMGSARKDPFILYIFDNVQDATAALLGLSFIHQNPGGGLVCTEVLVYGYYRRDDGLFEAIICGDELTIEMWEMAKVSFESHNGRRKNDLQPTRSAANASNRSSADASRVKFVREDRQNNRVYRVYKGPNGASAKAFLDEHPVEREFYYFVVETPDGNFCRDRMGMYKE